jgi:hypothetical protein
LSGEQKDLKISLVVDWKQQQQEQRRRMTRQKVESVSPQEWSWYQESLIVVGSKCSAKFHN